MPKTVRLSVLAVCAGTIILLAVGLVYQQVGEWRDARSFPAPGVLVTIGDHRLHLRCIGRGSPTVVILSGGGTPAVTSFAAQDGIAAFTRVCSYDRAGLGWSSRGSRVTGLRGMTDDLQRLLSRGGVPSPYILVPESFGGLLALSLVRRIPDQIAGIVFVDADEPKLWQSAMPGASAAWRFHDWWWRSAVQFGAVRAAFNDAAPAWVRALPDLQREQLRSVYARPSIGYNEAVSAFEMTRSTDIPSFSAGQLGSKPVTVLVHGKENAILGPVWEAGWPQAQHRLAALSSRSRIVIVANTSHMLAGENPQAVIAAVKDMVGRQRAGTPSGYTSPVLGSHTSIAIDPASL